MSYILESMLVGLIPHVDCALLAANNWYCCIYDCKIIAFVNFQWLERYLFIIIINVLFKKEKIDLY